MPKPEFVYVTYIETTPEKLWDALTKSEFTRKAAMAIRPAPRISFSPLVPE